MGEALRDTNLQPSVFFDKDPAKQGTFLHGVPVDTPLNLLKHEYEKIIIASAVVFEEEILDLLLSAGVPADKIILGSLLKNGSNNTLSAMDTYDRIDICASGISYHKHGILNTFSSYEIFNYAKASLDIYYDYCLAKKVLERRKNIKAWCIGLTHYSLHYDMSLSRTWKNAFYYSEMFGYHHLSEDRKQYYLAHYSSKKNSALFSKEFLRRLLDLEYELSVFNRDGIDRATLPEKAKHQARIDFNKHYPATVRENRAILERYVEMLEKNRVVPILTVVPSPSMYRANMRPDLSEEFLSFVDSLQKNHACHFVDGHSLPGFTDNDFMDASHVNVRGGEKFTRHLDQCIASVLAS